MFETNLVSNNLSTKDLILGSWDVHVGLEIEFIGLGFCTWKSSLMDSVSIQGNRVQWTWFLYMEIEPRVLGFLRSAHGHELTKEENTHMLCFTLYKTEYTESQAWSPHQTKTPQHQLSLSPMGDSLHQTWIPCPGNSLPLTNTHSPGTPRTTLWVDSNHSQAKGGTSSATVGWD